MYWVFSMKNICIIYNGGTYGTFIEWCLHYFSDLSVSDVLPFTPVGNSHNFKGNYLPDHDAVDEYVNSPDDFLTVRYHIKRQEQDDTLKRLEFICDNFKKIIFMHCTSNSFIWNINNKIDKVHKEGWLNYEKYGFKNLDQWGVGKNIDTMAPWEIREFLSFYLQEQHTSESDLRNIDQIRSTFTNVCMIPIENLRDEFTQTIKRLLDYCELPLVRNNFDYVYDQWISLQFHKNKDQLLKEIVMSIINNEYLDWASNNLTLADTAMIQHSLRQQGLEIKCHGLDKFPTNSLALKELLYAN